jgi:hypothetical protein
VNYANTVLASTGRGYSWQLIEIVTVPGSTAPSPADTNAANSWFNLPVNAANQDDLDTKAKSNPGGFQYRNNAVNFYYVNRTNSGNGGYCAFPSENQNAILFAPDSFADVLIHESGHFFSLNHTHDSQGYKNSDGSVCTNTQPCTCAQALGGDDGVADTPLDNVCWTRDNIAQAAYGTNYTNLNSSQQFFVDNSFLNVMSYHSPGVRFTDDQMDFVTDASNTTRLNVATGQTWFVDRTHGGPQDGSRLDPYVTVAQGVAQADDRDIVLIRPGNYNEPGTYIKPVTFHATRGSVTIGAP